MKIHYVLMTFVLMLTCNANPSFAGNVTIPNTFKSKTKAMASEVNANFKVIETEVNDNDSRVATLEEERSYTVFSLGEALHYLPDPDATTEDLLTTAERTFNLTVIQYREGLFGDIDAICQWSKRWQDIAYLAASDDKGRLTAFEDHANRMESMDTIADLRFRAGAVTEVDPLTTEYFLIWADALLEGFKAKTGQ